MDSPLVMGSGSLSSTTNTDLPVPLKKFYQGEPLALGITQIFIGILGIIFGILFDVVDSYAMIYIIIKMPYWNGILYIISGSLAVAAARNPKISLVQGALAMNVISAVTAGIGIIFLSFSITFPFVYHYYHFCHEYDLETVNCRETINTMVGILAILIAFNILEFCITISVASFGCKIVCRNSFTETVVVIYQNSTPANAEHPPIDCKQPESP